MTGDLCYNKEEKTPEAAGIVIGVLIYLWVGLWAYFHLIFTCLFDIWNKTHRKGIQGRSFDDDSVTWQTKLCTSIFIIIAILTCLVGLLLLLLIFVYWLLIKIYWACKKKFSENSAMEEIHDWKDMRLVRHTASGLAFITLWMHLDWEKVLSGKCDYCKEVCGCCPCSKNKDDDTELTPPTSPEDPPPATKRRSALPPIPPSHRDLTPAPTSRRPGLHRSDNRVMPGDMDQWQSNIPGTPGYIDEMPEDDCNIQALCRRFLRELKIGANYMDISCDQCYCHACARKASVENYSWVGSPAKLYAAPMGWVHFGLRAHPKFRDRSLDISQKWHIAYHGTSSANVSNILQTGELLMPGDIAMSGQVIEPPPGHFTEGRRPDGFDVHQIFTSPTMKYAGVPAYAKPMTWMDGHTGRKYSVQVALQLRIKPGCYQVGPQTIGLRRDQVVDQEFDNNELEWSTKHRGATVITGVLIKAKDYTQPR